MSKQPKDEQVIVLKHDQITADASTQSRVALDEQTIEKYKEMMLAGEEFPAIEVFFDGKTYWAADGFHRLAAAERAGKEGIAANVHKGDKTDAIIYSAGANQKHGLPRKQKDARRAIDMILYLELNKERQWSDRAIARHVKVTHNTVRKRREHLLKVLEAEKRAGKIDDNTKTSFNEVRVYKRNGKIIEQNTSKRPSKRRKKKGTGAATTQQSQKGVDETYEPQLVYDPDGILADLLKKAKLIINEGQDPEEVLSWLDAQRMEKAFNGLLRNPITNNVIFDTPVPGKELLQIKDNKYYGQVWLDFEELGRNFYYYMAQYEPEDVLQAIPLNYRHESWHVIETALDWLIKLVRAWHENYGDPAHLEKVLLMPNIDPFGLKKIKLLSERLYQNEQENSQSELQRDAQKLSEVTGAIAQKVKSDAVDEDEVEVANKLVEGVSTMQDAAPESEKKYVSIKSAQLALKELRKQLEEEGEDTEEVTHMLRTLHGIYRRDIQKESVVLPSRALYSNSSSKA